MDADNLVFSSSGESAAMEARLSGLLGQMDGIDAKIESVKKKLKRLEDVKKHLNKSFRKQFRKIQAGGQYAGRWRRSEFEFNSVLVGTVKDKADRLEDAVDKYVQGPLDPVWEGVDTKGLKSEMRALIDSRKRILDAGPMLDFSSLLRGWPLQSVETSRVLLARRKLLAIEARIKEGLLAMLLFLVFFLIEPEEREEEYRKLVTRLEGDVVANPRMKLIGKFLSLMGEALRRGREMPNLRRATRNILKCYSSMGFLEGEVNELLETLVDRIEHLDTVVRDIPRRMPGACIFRQLEWGEDMMIRCEETVKSVCEQMESVYGPCFVEWNSVISTWTRAA